MQQQQQIQQQQQQIIVQAPQHQIIQQIPSLPPQHIHHIQTINHTIPHQSIIYQPHQPTQILQVHQIKKETS